MRAAISGVALLTGLLSTPAAGGDKMVKLAEGRAECIR